MKKILLITLLLIPVLGFSQTTKPIDGFLGVKFGSSKADVTAALKKRGATVLTSNDPNDTNVLYFGNVTLGHRSALQLNVWFVDDKAFAATFTFKAEVDDKTIDYYNDLVADINGIYGVGKSIKKFKDPYKEGDGYEITGIEQGDVNFYTDWLDGSNNVIEAKIGIKLYVTLLYRDSELGKIADAKQKAKESSDY